MSDRNEVGNLNALVEDPDERRMFDDEVARLCDGEPLLQIALALKVWHHMAPDRGSYGKVLAIYSNEIYKAAIAKAEGLPADSWQPIETARELLHAYRLTARRLELIEVQAENAEQDGIKRLATTELDRMHAVIRDAETQLLPKPPKGSSDA